MLQFHLKFLIDFVNSYRAPYNINFGNKKNQYTYLENNALLFISPCPIMALLRGPDVNEK